MATNIQRQKAVGERCSDLFGSIFKNKHDNAGEEENKIRYDVNRRLCNVVAGVNYDNIINGCIGISSVVANHTDHVLNNPIYSYNMEKKMVANGLKIIGSIIFSKPGAADQVLHVDTPTSRKVRKISVKRTRSEKPKEIILPELSLFICITPRKIIVVGKGEMEYNSLIKFCFFHLSVFVFCLT